MEVLRLEEVNFDYSQEQIGVATMNVTVKQGDFILLMGDSGSGKSTLLRLFKPEMQPKGLLNGRIYINGHLLTQDNQQELSLAVGFVQQDPDSQIVTDRVWSELAFGLENIGLPQADIQLRIAEMATYFGIENWYHSKTSDLSGGQKQLLNLASVLVMQPNILLLDEPTSQLDPIAKEQFIEALVKINRELNMTIVMVEHDVEQIFARVDKVWQLSNGQLISDLQPSELAYQVITEQTALLPTLPLAVQVSQHLHLATKKDKIPLTIKEGIEVVKQHVSRQEKLEDEKEWREEKEAIGCQRLTFGYHKNQRPIISDVSLSIKAGTVFSLLGGNGVGKSTFIKVLTGLLPKVSGKITVFGKKIEKVPDLYGRILSVLPQNPATVFFEESIMADFYAYLANHGLTREEQEQKITKTAQRLAITDLLLKHPLDLSGGERQKVAIAKLLLLEPKIMVLDEPTKGIDTLAKRELTLLLKQLATKGMTLIIVTHDTAFAAEVSDVCGMMFDGNIIGMNEPREFFSQNLFYTTAINRLLGSVFPNVVNETDMARYIRQVNHHE